MRRSSCLLAAALTCLSVLLLGGTGSAGLLGCPQKVVGGAVLCQTPTVLVAAAPTDPALPAAPAPAPTAPAPDPVEVPAPVPATSGLGFGVLQPAVDHLPALRTAGVSHLVLSVAWDRYEPRQGAFSSAYRDQVRALHRQYTDAGFSVTLSLGLQYPPDWVFALPGGTRFVNQHGESWVGGTGDDVPDAVFNQHVRAAQGAYLAQLGRDLAGLPLDAVRIGGLVRGELHYPMPNATPTPNSYWAFGPSALAASPVPAFRPGTGDAAGARVFLAWYLEQLTAYGEWQLRAVRAAFGPAPSLLVLQPSWGVRPGEPAAAADRGLDGTARGERRGTLNEGLDWERQAPRFAAHPGTVLYTTWLDAPDQGTDDVYESPVRYLARLAARHGLPVAGENTGTGSLADMQLSVDRSRELGLTRMFWMRSPDLFSGGYATVDDYRAVIAGSSRRSMASA